MDFEEKLAEMAHEQWSGWMRYLFEKSSINEDGTCTIPKWATDRWVRQMNTPYDQLSQSEQESDRKEGAKFMALFTEFRPYL